MDRLEEDMGDKQWAKKYLLDPLHCPEPSQECGPGSSFRHPGVQRSLSVQTKSTPGFNKSLPTPPPSSSPTRSRFFRSKQKETKPSTAPKFEKTGYQRLDEDRREQNEARLDEARLENILFRSQSVNDGHSNNLARNARRHPPQTQLNRSKTVHTLYPRPTKWNEGTILNRGGVPREPYNRQYPNSPNHLRPNSADRFVPYPVQSPFTSPLASPLASPMASPVAMNRDMDMDKGKGLSRSGSLSARFPGDMSHRPLDVLKREHRAADRTHRMQYPRRKLPGGASDTIDKLDDSGIVPVPYHHDGPYDPTLASRNTNKLYSPLDAVKDSNEEAIKATPQEYIKDSLTKHVPLQGTAAIPPGMSDFSGRKMEYREGADLMREVDAPGGAYKRYDGIPYRDDDYKGKGEPSFTVERDHKEQKASLKKQAGFRGDNGGTMYEMQPGVNGHGSSRKENGSMVRQRSVSNVDVAAQTGPSMPIMHNDSVTTNTGLQRRNTTGRFTAGLKRTFGSIRRKKNVDL